MLNELFIRKMILITLQSCVNLLGVNGILRNTLDIHDHISLTIPLGCVCVRYSVIWINNDMFAISDKTYPNLIHTLCPGILFRYWRNSILKFISDLLLVHFWIVRLCDYLILYWGLLQYSITVISSYLACVRF